MNKILFLYVFIASFGLHAEEVGKVTLTGIIFNDSIKVVAFDDPQIKGITCYATYYDRGFSISDSGSVSISCRKTGSISGSYNSNHNVFSQKKGWLFKKTIVSRMYDSRRGVLVYLAYTDLGSEHQAHHSISVVNIN